MEQGRGGGDCRRGRLIARWFAGAAPVVGRWLCIAIFGGAKGFYRVGLCVWV